MAASQGIPEFQTYVHLFYPHLQGKIQTRANSDPLLRTIGGRYMIACSPDQGTIPRSVTDSCRATTCPLCLDTEAFKRIQIEQTGGMNEADKRARDYALAKLNEELSPSSTAPDASDGSESTPSA